LLHKYLSESRRFKVERNEQRKHSLLWELQRISKTTGELSDGDGMIRWFESADETRTAVGGVPKDLENDTFYIPHFAALIRDVFGRFVTAVNLTDEAVKNFNLARVRFIIWLMD